MSRIGLLSMLLSFSASLASAQGPLPHPSKAKDVAVVPRFSLNVPLQPKHDDVWITESNGAVMIENFRADDVLAFPDTTKCKVGGTRDLKSFSLTSMDIKCGRSSRKLYIPIDPAAGARVFNYVFAPADQAGSIALGAMKRVSDRVFVGSLSAIEEARRIQLLTIARAVGGSPLFSSQEFLGKTYFKVDLGANDYVYNDLQVSPNQRLARAINDRLLTFVKTFDKAVDQAAGMEGIAFAIRIGHRSFVPLYEPNQFDEVLLYVPSPAIRRFASAEITGQDLIDQAAVIVNGNRTKVVLADG